MSNSIIPFKPMSPCKDCTDRRISDDYNCHSDCSAYLSYRAEIAAGDDAKRRQMDWNSNKWMSKDRRRCGY